MRDGQIGDQPSASAPCSTPNMYRDFLAGGHEGMQHWSSWPENYDEIYERALATGYTVGQEGDDSMMSCLPGITGAYDRTGSTQAVRMTSSDVRSGRCLAAQTPG
jgi:hypothetical protein